MNSDRKQLKVSSLMNMNIPELQLDTRSKILQAAIKVFSKSGYAGSSLRDITDLAGVNHGSVKYHYSNKQELWRATVRFLYNELDNFFQSPSQDWDDIPAMNKVELGIRLYIRFTAKNPALFKITMFETMYDSSQFDWLMENITIPYAKRSLEFIEKAQAEGAYSSKIPPMNLFYLMLGATRNIFLVAAEVERIFGKDVFSHEEVRRHEDAAVELVLGHISATNTKP